MEGAPQDQEQEQEQEEEERVGEWGEMLEEALVMVFKKLCLRDMFITVPFVCRTWRRASLDPLCWECVDLRDWTLDFAKCPEDVDRMVRLVVDRSAGTLKHFSISEHATDNMLLYIAHRCSLLKCLRFSYSSDVTDDAFSKAASKFPDLEELDISGCQNLSTATLQEIGKSCKGLVWLERNGSEYCDEEAFTIAKTMPKLKHLEMTDTHLTNEGLNALLDGCKNIEHLDLRRCRNLTIENKMKEKCSNIKELYVTETEESDGYSLYSDYFEEVDVLSDFDLMEFYEHYDPYHYFNEISWWPSAGS